MDSSRAQSFNCMDEDVMRFFKGQNYKVSSSIGQKRASMHAITPVLDSETGSNLIHLQCVSEPWGSVIISTQISLLIDPLNRTMNALDRVALLFCSGEFIARVLLRSSQALRLLYPRNNVLGSPREAPNSG